MIKKKKAEAKKKKPAIKKKNTNVSKRGISGEGRPRKYNTAEELQAKIEEYYESCWVDKITEVTDKEGNCTMSTVRYQNRPYTVAGLAYELGFVDRHSLLDYEKDSRFSSLIKMARNKIEMYHEEELGNKNPAGHIFWLKNHAKYVDKQELGIGNPDGTPLEITVTFVEAKNGKS